MLTSQEEVGHLPRAGRGTFIAHLWWSSWQGLVSGTRWEDEAARREGCPRRHHGHPQWWHNRSLRVPTWMASVPSQAPPITTRRLPPRAVPIAATVEKNSGSRHANTTEPTTSESTRPLVPTPWRPWTTHPMSSHGKTKRSRASQARWGCARRTDERHGGWPASAS
jgi:hypothetical protein